MMRFRVAASALLASLGLGAASSIKPSDFHDSQIVTRDVCVIGGGSAGTYAAIRLRENGQTVAVVEQSSRLGGHTDTYIDPDTNTPVDYGVLVYGNLTVVHDYFAHFNIPLVIEPADGGAGEPERIDFRSGEPVQAPQGNVTDALARYAAQLQRHPYLRVGFDLPDPVPEDLLLPLGEFVDKYDLGAVVDIIALYVQGVGDVLSLQTLYVMKYFSIEVLEGVHNGFVQTADHNNGALYVAAEEELASDILFNSTVAGLDRDSDPDWVYVLVQTPEGRRLVRARHVFFAIPPKPDNLRGFDLDDIERSLFGEFSNTYFYTALARIDGLPPGKNVLNRALDTPYNLPPFPSIYVIRPTAVPGVYNIIYGSEDPMSESEVKDDMVRSVLRLQTEDIHADTPEFIVYNAHNPFELTVPSGAIADGFYRELQGLQGRRRTYYTGATFDAHDSARVWRFTEVLLQSLLKKG